ncbi:MAG: hypothetical protein ACP5RF_01795 [Candidatus Micrarchaeia archaeon]
MKTFYAVAILTFLLASSAGLAESAVCPFVISGNGNTYIMNYSISCANNTVMFAPNSSSNILDCNSHSLISGNDAIAFLNNSFNNTVVNCTIDGNVLSMHGAQNNIVNSTGNYNLEFTDNTSNIAMGNFFHLLLYGPGGAYTIGRFIQIMPNELAEKAPYVVAMNVKMSDFIKAAKAYNITLPRFGLFPNTSSNGSSYFMLESKQVSKNNIINFNPYLYDTPYWGYDILGYTRFNISKNVVFKPTYLRPFIYQNEILPANKPVYWNYTIIFNNNESKVNKLRLLNGYQGDPNATVSATFYNITSGNFTYEKGFQKPGIYEFIALLDTPYEHENSTTEAYSVGLSFCTRNSGGITSPGYYPFAYNSLDLINVFWLTNEICPVGMNIGASNVSINCRGGSVHSTIADFYSSSQKNVSISNCTLYGNGIIAEYSSITIYNTTFIANNSSDIAISSNRSSIYLNEVKFVNFANAIENKDSNITYVSNTANSSKQPSATTINTTSTISTTIAATSPTKSPSSTPKTSITAAYPEERPPSIFIIISVLAFVLFASATLYLLIGRLNDSKHRPKGS